MSKNNNHPNYALLAEPINIEADSAPVIESESQVSMEATTVPTPRREKKTTKVIRTSLYLPEKLHTAFRIECLRKRTSMTEQIQKLIKESLSK